MTDSSTRRRPAAFRLDDPKVKITAPEDAVGAASGGGQILPQRDNAGLSPELLPPVALPRKRFRWGYFFGAAVGGLLLLSLGLWVNILVEELFARSRTLGFVGAGLAAIAAIALLVMVLREIFGLLRLASVERLRQRAAIIVVNDDRSQARNIVDDLLRLVQHSPQLARARTTMRSHLGEIIDGSDLLRLAERELVSPLDVQARLLVSDAAKRVSVVTAVSPRAALDLIFVFGTAISLIRSLAYLYGSRPTTLGLFRLLRHVVSHLLVTGGLAAGDSLLQQVFGHGITAKVSARLGEGVLNGLLTARVGLAAIEVTRPLPFIAQPRPLLRDLAADLLRQRPGQAESQN